MFNKVILIARLGQNAEAKTAQNNREYDLRTGSHS
jgi:single-strand DNA-binding protein